MAEKQLPASQRRRDKARQQGQVARTHELGAALGLLGFALALRSLGPGAGRAVADWAANVWSQVAVLGAEVPAVSTLPATSLLPSGGRLGWGALDTFVQVGAPLMVIGIVAALAGTVLQGGFVFTGAPLQPKLDRINPVTGLGRLFSARSAVELGKAVLKLGALAFAVYSPAADLLHALPGMIGDAGDAGGLVFGASTAVLTRTGAALLAMSAADLAYQRWELDRSLRMSREEMKEELRETEGDPHVRSLRRRRQRELARRRMMRDVKRADVVVTNPTHFAVALRYAPDETDAPVVLAKGRGWLAERIKQVARANSVIIMENPPLAQALYKSVAVGRSIPPALYQAVAEVLSFVWRLKGRA